jgi:hypothetical protein
MPVDFGGGNCNVAEVKIRIFARVYRSAMVRKHGAKSNFRQ